MTNEMELVAMGVISDKGCVLENDFSGMFQDAAGQPVGLYLHRSEHEAQALGAQKVCTVLEHVPTSHSGSASVAYPMQENRTMKDSTLDKAMLDALAFLRAARALRSARKRGEGVRVASGAAQRASMDLTRRLADLRQGR